MKLCIFSDCNAIDIETDEVVSDLDRIKAIDGYTYMDDEEDDCFGFWLIDENDNSLIKNSGISGGYLYFKFKAETQGLEVSVTYNLEGELSEEQIDSLIEYTVGQCTDGIGSNFNQIKCEEFGMFFSLIEEREIVKYEII